MARPKIKIRMYEAGFEFDFFMLVLYEALHPRLRQTAVGCSFFFIVKMASRQNYRLLFLSLFR